MDKGRKIKVRKTQKYEFHTENIMLYINIKRKQVRLFEELTRKVGKYISH